MDRTRGPGEVLKVIRSEGANTRAAIVQHTGLARSTVAQRVDALLAAGLIYEAGDTQSTGGRRAARLAFNPGSGVILAADLGATHSRIAVSDLEGRTQVELAFDRDIAEGPEKMLTFVHGKFRKMLKDAGVGDREVRGIGVGIPGPVAFATGQPVSPPIMPGWDAFSIPEWFRERWGEVPVLVDNDVNIMALGEHWEHWREVDHVLFVKIGTGIGSGIVLNGRIHRGADGAAGDIGHIVTDHDDVVCRCGNTGCLEAVAGGYALAQRLSAAGYEAETSRDVVRLVREGNTDAIRLVRDAGRALGQVLAACVNLVNPSVVVVGGDIGDVHEHLLAGLREVVIQRSLPLATGNLRIVSSRLGDRAGVTGAAIMAVDHILSPAAVDRALRDVA